jgi:hypothetical protein
MQGLLFYIWGLVPETEVGFMIFFTDNAMAADARTTKMNNVATIGNSGVLVGVLDGAIEGVLEGVFEGVFKGVLEDPALTAVTESAVSV